MSALPGVKFALLKPARAGGVYVLAQNLREADADSFLGGVETYLFKLGPENLGSMFAHSFDRKVAASIPAVSMRLRLQDMARLMADALLPALETSDAVRPLLA